MVMAIKHSWMMHQEPMESSAKIATGWNINRYLFSLICSVHYLYNCVFFIRVIVEAICESLRAFTSALAEQ